MEKGDSNQAKDQDPNPLVHQRQKPPDPDVQGLSGHSRTGLDKSLRLAVQRLLLFKKSVSCLILSIDCLSEPDQPKSSKPALFAKGQYNVVESEEDFEEQATPPVHVSTVEPRAFQGKGEAVETKNQHKSDFSEAVRYQPNEQVDRSLHNYGHN